MNYYVLLYSFFYIQHSPILGYRRFSDTVYFRAISTNSRHHFFNLTTMVSQDPGYTYNSSQYFNDIFTFTSLEFHKSDSGMIEHSNISFRLFNFSVLFIPPKLPTTIFLIVILSIVKCFLTTTKKFLIPIVYFSTHQH